MFDFSAFPVLQTERLLLRQVTPDDASGIYGIRGDYDVTRLNTGIPYSHLGQAADLARHIGRVYNDRREIWWAVTVRPNPALVGMCILYELRLADDTPCAATLGYELARDWWGRGIMTEAARAAVDWSFPNFSLDRIDADALAENVRSTRLLEHLGFRHEGRRVGARWMEGQARDLELYALVRSDWRPESMNGE